MLCYSSLGLPELPIGRLCELVGEFGYEGLEIALTPEHIERAGDDDFWREACGDARRRGIALTNLHLGNPRLNPDPTLRRPTFLADDAATRRMWTGYIQAAVTIAGRVGAPLVTAASGPPNEALDRGGSFERLLAGLTSPLARLSEGCLFLMEHEPEHFIRTADDLIELHERSGKGIWANLDVGHAEVVPEPIGGAIEKLGALIKNVHLEDIKDHVHRHLLPGEGDINFAEVGRALKAIGYKGPLTADLYPYVDRHADALRLGHEAFSALM